jgi:transcriptional regulator with PAS, ATPase and Fis domain
MSDVNSTCDFNFENSQDFYINEVYGVIVIDMSGKIRYLNKQCMKLIGYTNPTYEQAKELFGSPVEDVFPYTHMLDNLAPEITKPKIVFYKSNYGMGISMNVPLIYNGEKIGLMEYDLVNEEKVFFELTDDYNAFLNNQLKQLQKKIIKLEQNKYTIDNIIGFSAPMNRLRQQIVTVAKSNSTVLIMGETGTGKELVAHSIHNLSNRKFNPMVKINASAFPENLVESELFGYTKGSFTGADKDGKVGKFEYANHGTLFIDEIQQMPLSTQPKLLRVLQEHEVEPIGSNESVPVDVRVIVASNRDIHEMVKDHRFREDLFYRLNVIKIEIPPLREHLEDIDELVDYYINQLNHELGFKINGVEPSVLNILKQYNWPGNIRELRNVLERAMNFASGSTLTTGDFNFFIRTEKQTMPDYSSNGNIIEETKRKAEKELIETVLQHFGYNKTHSANFLNISRPLLHQKIKRLGISAAPPENK